MAPTEAIGSILAGDREGKMELLVHRLRIQLWEYNDAPEALRNLFASAPPSSWIAHVPAELGAAMAALILESECTILDARGLQDGSIVYIGRNPSNVTPVPAPDLVSGH
jgi:uncharacterized membrane protein